MKYKLHLPTGDFAFIEQEVEVDSPTEAVDAFKALLKAYKGESGGAGLTPKDWNTALDSYINGNPMAPDTYYSMSPEQQKIIQELKKCFKRLKGKNNEYNPYEGLDISDTKTIE